MSSRVLFGDTLCLCVLFRHRVELVLEADDGLRVVERPRRELVLQGRRVTVDPCLERVGIDFEHRPYLLGEVVFRHGPQ